MSRKRVFISHISSETELAQSLKKYLEKHFLGLLEIFVSSDRETIQAGSKWLEEVNEALKSADLQIILCSEESVGRPWVNFEAGAVWLRGIPVIPLCHSGLRPNDSRIRRAPRLTAPIAGWAMSVARSSSSCRSRSSGPNPCTG